MSTPLGNIENNPANARASAAVNIVRLDGRVSQVIDGRMRLQAAIEVLGKADVIDPETGVSFSVSLRDGEYVEVEGVESSAKTDNKPFYRQFLKQRF
jgi:hypothetical protein